MIPKETIDLIFETARIEEVVGDYVHLKKRGVNMLGLCPFHNEKTPSFTVSPAKGIYKCFGCGKGGNSVNFVMDLENFSYPEALKHLAGKYQIEIEEEEQSPEQQQAASERESLYIVSEFANKYYQDILFENDEGRAIGLSYFKERGYTLETIKKFQLGYNPDHWSAFTDAAIKEGYRQKYLSETGLTIVKENKRFDRFKGRVMFPIQSLSGKILGFGGRILKKNDKAAKYLNSPESKIYHKSKVLYGIYHAKKSIIQHDKCYLVEGYTDVISLHQAGVENVVASSGTSLTPDQIRLIKRFTNNITILFDGDKAGIKAAFRGLDLILEEGMNVRIVSFPDGEDPDSFAKSVSSDKLQRFLTEEAHDFIEYKTSMLYEEAKNDPVKKAALIKDIVASISLLPDHTMQTVYVQASSKLLEIDEKTLFRELEQRISGKIQKEQKSKPRYSGHPNEIPDEVMAMNVAYSSDQEPISIPKFQLEEETIIRRLLNHGTKEMEIPMRDDEGRILHDEEPHRIHVAEMIIEELREDDINFEDTTLQKIYLEAQELLDNGRLAEIESKHFVHHQDPEISKTVSGLIISQHELSKWEDKEIFVPTEVDKLNKLVEEDILRLKYRHLQVMTEELRDQLKKPDCDFETIFKELTQYTQVSNHILKKLGREC
mgnify:CR=1 FL=1